MSEHGPLVEPIVRTDVLWSPNLPVADAAGNLDPVPRVKAAGGTTLVLYFDAPRCGGRSDGVLVSGWRPVDGCWTVRMGGLGAEAGGQVSPAKRYSR